MEFAHNTKTRLSCRLTPITKSSSIGLCNHRHFDSGHTHLTRDLISSDAQSVAQHMLRCSMRALCMQWKHSGKPRRIPLLSCIVTSCVFFLSFSIASKLTINEINKTMLCVNCSIIVLLFF